MEYIKFWDHNNKFHDYVKTPTIVQSFDANGDWTHVPSHMFKDGEEMFFLDFVVVDKPNEANPYLKKQLYQKVMSTKGIVFIPSIVKNGEPIIEAVFFEQGQVFQDYEFYDAFQFLDINQNKFGTYDIVKANKLPKSIYLPKIIETVNRKDKGWFVVDYIKTKVPELMSVPYINAFLDAAYASFADRDPESANYCKEMREAETPFGYAIKNKSLTQKLFITNKNIGTYIDIISRWKTNSYQNLNGWSFGDPQKFCRHLRFEHSAFLNVDDHINELNKTFNIIPQVVERFETEN
jgi:hypothetical protein